MGETGERRGRIGLTAALAAALPRWFLLPGRRGRRIGLTAALAAALVAVAALFVLARMGGYATVRAVDDLTQAAAAATAAVASLLAGRRLSGRPRRGWFILALGLSMWTGGQLIWCWFDVLRARAAPFPSPADIGFLSFPVTATVGVCLIAGDDHLVDRVRVVADGLIVAGSLLIVSWATTLGVTVRAGGPVDLSRIVSVAYPAFDIVLLTMTVQMITHVRRARSSLVLFAAGTIALALADSNYTYLSAVGHYHTGGPLDLGWVGGFGLVAVAASAARRHPASHPSDRRAPTALLPYAVPLVAVVVMLGMAAAGRPTDPLQRGVTLLVVVAVLTRQYRIVRENQELVRTVKAREVALQYQAYHDHLTGLPNRALFNDRVACALALHGRNGGPLTVLFCDLDEFKVVNDTLGHGAGDELLVQVAERMRTVVRAGDTLARLGGDEFAVLVEGADGVGLARRLTGVLAPPVLLGEHLTAVHASIGVCVVAEGEAAPDASILLADADTAMYAAKREGSGGLRLFEPSMRRRSTDDLGRREALTAALVAGDVHPVFQPIVDPSSGQVHAVEALARWRRDGTDVSPGLFVPLAERLGLISLLTDTILEQAVDHLARWSAELGHHDLRLSVNVSASELGIEGRLLRRVSDLLARAAIRSDQLILEITESAVAADEAVARRVLAQLRGLGVRTALDDFGKGQSSLSRLQRFPIDYLKLDGAMIREVGTSRTQAAIVRSITDLGRELEVQVIAEWVETPDQLGRLLSLDAAPLLQGFGLSRPLPAAEVMGLLLSGVDLGRPPAALVAPRAVRRRPGRPTLAGARPGP